MDDTLYCASAGMFDAIHRAMRHDIARRLNLTTADAQRLQEAYWSRYGATFLGLERHHGIAPEDFLQAAHDFAVEPLAVSRVAAASLRRLIGGLPGRKVILTNGPRRYAHRILRSLHVEDLFSGVLTSNDMHRLGRWRCKPDEVLLHAAAGRAGAALRDCVLVEDSLRNLRQAKRLGLQTVWCVGNAGHRVVRRPVYVDAVISTVKDLPRLVAGVRSEPPVREVDGRYH